MSFSPEQRFIDRVGAALAAPTTALRVAADDSWPGRAGTDAALFLLLATVCLQTPKLIVAGFLVGADSIRSGASALVQLLAHSVGTDLLVIFGAGALIALGAGTRRSLARDFDMGCVAYLPFATVRVAAELLVLATGIPLTRAFTDAVGVVALAWAALVALLAVRSVRRPATTSARGDRAPRWAGRVAMAGLAAALAVNVANTARNWDQIRPISPGDVAPLFELPALEGDGRVALSELRGQVVLLDFWATWCRPCRASMPMLDDAYRRWRDRGLVVLSVNTEGPEARARAQLFAERLELTFPIAVDDGRVAYLYGVTDIPHLVLIDRRGVIRGVHRGVPSDFEAFLTEAVEPLLRER